MVSMGTRIELGHAAEIGIDRNSVCSSSKFCAAA